MKAIVLYTAQVDNSGQRHDAGETVSIGKGDAEILPTRARELVEARLAADAAAGASAEPQAD